MNMQKEGSWQFLLDFYEQDNSIVELLNRALRIKSNCSIRGVNGNILLNDIMALVSKECKPVSYTSFLQYITPIEKEETDSIDDEELNFINHIWINICGNSSANSFLSKEFRQNGIPPVCTPYLSLLSMGISEDWFLYGGISKNCFVDQYDKLEILKRKLVNGLNVWYRNWSFIKNDWKYKLLGSNSLVPREKLYPLMTLLIVLRREWLYSQDNTYINLKIQSLSKQLEANRSIIYSIYNKYKFCNESILQDVEYDPIEFHRLIANRIIENEAYDVLFDFEYNDEITTNRIENFSFTERQLDEKGKKGKKEKIKNRLLVDYAFPYTKVRTNDIFIPRKSLIDEIYLSLKIGLNYKEYYRLPKDGETFDYIQIVPNADSQGSKNNQRLIPYRKYLKVTGDFLIVISEDEDKINSTLKDIFSEFRHDLKGIMDVSMFSVLTRYIESFQKIHKLMLLAKEFIKGNNNLFDDILDLLGDSGIDVFSKQVDFNFNESLESIRNEVEKSNFNEVSNSYESLNETLSGLIDLLIRNYELIISMINDKIKSISFSYNVLCSYVKMAGSNPFEYGKDNGKLNLKSFLLDYISYIPSSFVSMNCKISHEIKEEYIVSYDKNVLTIMLNSILENAVRHGFSGNSECKYPEIHFKLENLDNFLLLKICNNGTPINIRTEDYITKGVCLGITGNTGLGGYQISKYAELYGGHVEVFRNKDWNTEIHLFIKK